MSRSNAITRVTLAAGMLGMAVVVGVAGREDAAAWGVQHRAAMVAITARATGDHRSLDPSASELAMSGAPLVAEEPATVGPPPVLTVEVQGIEAWVGELRVGLFGDDASFAACEQPLRHCILPLGSDEAADCRVIFADLPPGDYALAVFHDRDADGELDRSLFGIPSEPYGFSNDAHGRFGPPDFNAAAFAWSGAATTHRLTLR